MGHADRRVLDALASLKEDDREALLLVAWEGLSHRDAARVLGVRETTFGVRLHRARRRLVRALAGDDPGVQPNDPDSNPMTTRQETHEPA